MASLALLHLRVDISATADPYLGARECLGAWCSPGGAGARDNTSERRRRLARDPGNEIREGDKVPASKHTQRWGGRGAAGLGYHHCQSVSPEDQPGEPSPFREMNKRELVGKGWAKVQGSRAGEGKPPMDRQDVRAAGGSVQWGCKRSCGRSCSMCEGHGIDKR